MRCPSIHFLWSRAASDKKESSKRGSRELYKENPNELSEFEVDGEDMKRLNDFMCVDIDII